MQKPILEIQNLSFQFGAMSFSKNLNFKINKNENWQIGGAQVERVNDFSQNNFRRN